MNLLIWEYIRPLTYYWSGYLYSNIRYSAKNIQLFEYIYIFAKLWYIFMSKYYSVFHICKISWTNTIWYSVFGNISWTNTIWYSEIFHERIYSVFGKIHYSVQLCMTTKNNINYYNIKNNYSNIINNTINNNNTNNNNIKSICLMLLLLCHSLK